MPSTLKVRRLPVPMGCGARPEGGGHIRHPWAVAEMATHPVVARVGHARTVPHTEGDIHLTVPQSPFTVLHARVAGATPHLSLTLLCASLLTFLCPSLLAMPPTLSVWNSSSCPTLGVCNRDMN